MKKGIKLHLVQRGLTMVELAARLGYKRQYLYDIFQGNRRALKVRQRLIDEFGFPEELVRYNPPPQRQAA